MLFTTPRLVVRPFEPADATAVLTFWGDADSVRQLGSGEPWVTDEPSAGACIARTRQYYEEHQGYGIFGIELKADRSLAGHVLLKPMDTGEVEIGWLVSTRQRGLGVASEAAEGMLRYGFKIQGLESIVAIMFPENKASRRVAERLGMHFQGTRMERDYTVAWYALQRTDFAKAPDPILSAT